MPNAKTPALPCSSPRVVPAHPGLKGWVVVWAMGTTFSAYAETRSLRHHEAAEEATALKTAMYPTDQRGTAGPLSARTAGLAPTVARDDEAPSDSSKHRDGSSIPTPVDNPWALGTLAVLLGHMVWMDRRARREKG